MMAKPEVRPSRRDVAECRGGCAVDCGAGEETTIRCSTKRRVFLGPVLRFGCRIAIIGALRKLRIGLTPRDHALKLLLANVLWLAWGKVLEVGGIRSQALG